jgi:hypothetical protein
MHCALQERSARSEVLNVMQAFSKTLPLYVWLVALPQLTSRICHPHIETQRITQHILTRVTANYPHQVRSPAHLIGNSSIATFSCGRSAFIDVHPVSC